MGCQRGKPIPEPKAGYFRCRECGAIALKKKKLCEPKKIKKR